MSPPNHVARVRPVPRIEPCIEVLRPPGPDVRLVPVTDEVLEGLVLVATSDASADEVTPRVGDGAGWTASRVAWLRRFHNDCRVADRGVATWAVEADGTVIGSVRLARTAVADVHEVGIWLARSARGRGIARAALGRLETIARELGALRLQATTTVANAAAMRLLSGRGYLLVVLDGRVDATLYLTGSDAPVLPAT